MARQIVSEPESRFLKVACLKCKNEQIIFNKTAKDVKCLVCGNILAEVTGGKSIIRSKILKVLS